MCRALLAVMLRADEDLHSTQWDAEISAGGQHVGGQQRGRAQFRELHRSISSLCRARDWWREHYCGPRLRAPTDYYSGRDSDVRGQGDHWIFAGRGAVTGPELSLGNDGPKVGAGSSFFAGTD